MSQTLWGVSKKDLTPLLRLCFNLGGYGLNRPWPSLMSVEIASFRRRLVALFADWTLSYFVAVFLATLHWGSASALQYLVFYLELFIFTSTTGASAGQHLMKLKVVSVPDGGYLTPGRVALRTLLIILVLPALFTKERRGYHDIFSKSLVINAV
jgi:uncharacterized RDD family membrane protein YckC